ncbi:MAG: hypothetical protein AAFN70_03760, partial [Planctomycetota bacterium]
SDGEQTLTPFFMQPVLRHIGSIVLVTIVALGHAPAWLHVAGCDDTACTHAAHCSDDGHCKDDGCPFAGRHSHRHQTSEDASGAKDSGAHDCVASNLTTRHLTSVDENQGCNRRHDSGACTICQSLTMATGVRCQLNPVVLRPDDAFATTRWISDSVSFFPWDCPLSRGPPRHCSQRDFPHTTAS